MTLANIVLETGTEERIPIDFVYIKFKNNNKNL